MKIYISDKGFSIFFQGLDFHSKIQIFCHDSFAEAQKIPVGAKKV